MIQITPSVSIDEKAFTFEFIHASGPGGQNVNKVATAVQLRFDVHHSLALPPETMIRLKKLTGRRLTQDGILVIEARRYRTQEQNKTDAIQRLCDLIRKSLVEPKPRWATRPSKAAKARRVESKKRRGKIKNLRQTRPGHND